ncbi:p1/s1 nuclease [Histomonas meleagridis]|uniref:p1/s1 nuclease n=1 Tax=Histomonas meleagridis TaxID=135588 RepID=UPI00355AA31C|nr:p1/s1 nuclease [Histomonas meleagridis]KAH0799748.1 p1/s1 nuclease [Histomonas meleagridis]
MLAIAFELGMRSVSSDYRRLMMNAYKIGGDHFTNAAEGAMFTYTARKPPYNIASFDHWHFRRDPINEQHLNISEHGDTDDVLANIDDTLQHLIMSDSTRPWCFVFNLKVFLSTICDMHSIFHVTELFTNEFPNGDDNAKNFYVKHNNNFISLFDLWETGCGLYPSLDWSQVNSTVDAIIKEYPTSTYSSSTTFSTTLATEIIAQTKNLTIEYGYAQLTNGSTVNDAYIEKCQQISRKQISEAGHALAEAFQRIAIPSFSEYVVSVPSVRQTEVVAWTIFAFLLPITLVIYFQKFCGN